MRRYLFAGVLTLAIYLVSEAAALLGLWVLRTRGIEYEAVPVDLREPVRAAIDRWLADSGTSLVIHSAELGWTPRANLTLPPLYRINGQGIRGDREYGSRPGPDTVRIGAFGDSFTFATGVRNDSTWERSVERSLDQVEVVNFGVPVYGVDQAFLRYQLVESQFPSDVVLIGFISHNLARHVNRFRPFYAKGSPLAKPRFRLEGGELVLLPNPLATLESYHELMADPPGVLPRLGEGDHHFESGLRASGLDVSPLVRLVKLTSNVLKNRRSPMYLDDQFNDATEGFAVTTAIFEQFVETVTRDGRSPLILLFPTRGDLALAGRGRPPVYQPLRRYFDQRGLPYVDLLDAFTACGSRCSLDEVAPPKSLHYSPLGNRIVGEHIAAVLQDRGILRLHR